MNRTFTLLGLALIGPASACAKDRATALAELDRAQATWSQNVPKNYSYTMLEGGAFGWDTYRVVVRGSSCKSQWKSGRRGSHWEKDDCDPNQIEKILSGLRSSLQYEFEPERLEVEFDPAYGFVKRLFVEPGGKIQDQQWRVEMKRFKKD
jgi:hypothetical protein